MKALDVKNSWWSSYGYVSQFPKEMLKFGKADYTTVIICRKGYFSFVVNGNKGECRCGEMLIFSRRVNRAILTESADLEVRIFCLRIDNMYDHISNAAFKLALHLRLNAKYYSVFSGAEIKEVDVYFDLIDKTLQVEVVEHTLYLVYEQKLLMLALAHKLCHFYQQQLDVKNGCLSSKNELILRFIKMVEDNYEKERSLTFYADKLCVTPKYLSLAVKKGCGVTVHEIIAEYVVSRMCYYLVNTAKSILEISEEMNFLSPSHFGIYFRRYKGMLPSDFRRRYSK